MWVYKKQEVSKVPEKAVAFVYLITNITNGRKYIGKKLFWFKSGKKKVESDWKTYTGSSKELNQDIQNGNLISKEILWICYNKTEASYMELVEQIERKVLLDSEYYNGFIGGKINGKGLGRYK